jgi:hypothetical protein
MPHRSPANLAHTRKSRVERAFLAADLHTGAKVLVAPTIVQSALLVGVNRTDAHCAAKRQRERSLIEQGLIPLMPSPHLALETNGNLPMSTIDIPDAELVNFVRSVGVNRVLDAAVLAEAAQ